MESLPPTLHVLPLRHPHIILPGNRLTLSVPKETGEELRALIEEYDEREKEEEEGYISPQTRRKRRKNRNSFLIAAVPVVSYPGASSSTASTETETTTPRPQGGDYLPPIQPQPHSNPNSDSEAHLSEWGTTARILRLLKPLSSSQNETIEGHSTLTVARGAPTTTNYIVSLQGLTRVKLLGRSDSTHRRSLPTTSLPLYTVSHAFGSAPDLEQLEPETLLRFKQSALTLLDRLTRDSAQKGKRETYTSIAEMLNDLDVYSSSSESLSRAAWMADVLVGIVINNYNDKLAILCTPSPSCALFTLASKAFTKQASILDISHKIASEVDESLSRAQKQFFLQQQLEAIRKELYNLQRQNSNTSAPSDGAHEGFGGTNPPPSQSSDLEAEDDELNVDPSEDASLFALKRKIEALSPGSEERTIASREWKRLRRIPPGSVENGVVRNHLEWLTSIPWPSSTLSAQMINSNPSLTLADARAQLDADHFGLDKVKKRLVEYLAVVRLRAANISSVTEMEGSKVKEGVEEKDGKEVVVYDKQQQQHAHSPPRTKRKPLKGPILLFVGPPGTGKTSLGQSVARALGRPFQRVALGGVRDEAEIRGHRRTYVASGPGLIVQALRKMGRGDGVLLLDEVDKIGHSNYHGDPAAALLEALDPEQNHAFNDHYINVPIDLSQILFICTANTLETVSLPFIDRCEVIKLSGYTPNEKLAIANRFLLPKQLEANGLKSPQVQITDAAMKEIVNRYTRGEAGVRGLERKIGSVIRAKVVEYADWSESRKGDDGDTSSVSYNPVVEQHDIERLLGIAPWDENIGLVGEDGVGGRAGVVYGLVVMGGGEGGVMPVETVMVPGEGKLRLTGMLGDVIKESAELALSWVKTNAYDLGITNSRSEDPLKVTRSVDIHVHLPAGAQKKDGPSAGIAIACALISLLTSLTIPSTTALTGEITLRGTVSPVGGIKEKVLGAHRAGLRKVILPWANRREVEMDVPKEVRKEVRCVFVRSVREAVDEAFGRGVVSWRRGGGGREGLEERKLSMLVESRL